MLAVLQFDAASARILGRLRGEDRLPNLAALEARGTRFDLDAPATMFAAGAQHTLYSGMELADHGLFYPFQWSAPDQRARDMADFYAPPSVWEQLAPTGSRTLAVDPYESRPPTVTPPGALVCGWQLHDRVVLRRWDVADRRPPTAAAGLRSPATGGRGVRSPLGQGDAPSAPASARRAGTGRRRQRRSCSAMGPTTSRG